MYKNGLALLESRLWTEEPNATLLVYVTLLGTADDRRIAVFRSVLDLAARARVTTEEAVEAVKYLEAPHEPEGRHIQRIREGWYIVKGVFE
jgi:hypothetical protein